MALAFSRWVIRWRWLIVIGKIFLKDYPARSPE